MISQKRQFASEFLSSAMIAFFGLAMVVPLCVSGFMNQFEFSILFGLLVAFDTIIFAPVSGAQFNPVVTVSMIVSGRQSVKTIVTYIAAQYLGWFFGSGMIYVVFWKQLKEFYESDSGNPVNLFFCSTEYIWTGVWVEIIWAAGLMIVILACLDDRLPNKPDAKLFPFAIGGYVAVAIAACGPYTGMALNGARDFGPRIAGFIYGKLTGCETSACFSDGRFLLYMFVPMLGGIAGTLFYDKFISRILPGK